MGNVNAIAYKAILDNCMLCGYGLHKALSCSCMTVPLCTHKVHEGMVFFFLVFFWSFFGQFGVEELQVSCTEPCLQAH